MKINSRRSFMIGKLCWFMRVSRHIAKHESPHTFKKSFEPANVFCYFKYRGSVERILMEHSYTSTKWNRFEEFVQSTIWRVWTTWFLSRFLEEWGVVWNLLSLKCNILSTITMAGISGTTSDVSDEQQTTSFREARRRSWLDANTTSSFDHSASTKPSQNRYIWFYY